MVNCGDIILLNFDLQSGHEQRGTRPALIISNKQFHKYFRNSIVCPITTTNRCWPTHLVLPDNLTTKGVIMCEQLKFVDLESRGFKFLEKVSENFLIDVLNIINMFFEYK